MWWFETSLSVLAGKFKAEDVLMSTVKSKRESRAFMFQYECRRRCKSCSDEVVERRGQDIILRGFRENMIEVRP